MPQLHVTVVYSPAPRRVIEVEIDLPAGATVAQALSHSRIGAAFPEMDFSLGMTSVGVWGRKVGQEQTLRDHDRIEIYRLLLVDPKVARRERFASQGARTTGLFAKKRAGAKAGY